MSMKSLAVISETPGIHLSGLPAMPRIQHARLVPPRNAEHVCERLDLLKKLGDRSAARTTFVIAAGGYGKTVLISQWCGRLSGQGIPFAYYLASERDRDEMAFVTMLAAAVERAGIRFADRLPGFQHALSPQQILDELLVHLELSKKPVTLIIDSFDRVEGQAINDLLNTLVTLAPSNFRLVLCSRIRPQIPFLALSVRDEVQLIDSDSLCLTREEISRFMVLPEQSREVNEIAELARGWPAIVHLYQLWSARQQSENRCEKFGGYVREVSEYLNTDILSALHLEQIRLLVDIADCEEVEPALVDFIRERTDGARLLEETASRLSSLIDIIGGENSPVYRLHPLLLDHLRARLARDCSRRTGLQKKAACWYLSEQRYVEAIRIAMMSRDSEVIDNVVHHIRPIHILLCDGIPALRGILSELSDTLLESRPRLRILAAIVHFKAGFFKEAISMLERIREDSNDFQDDPDGEPDSLRAEGQLTHLIFLGQLSQLPADFDSRCNSVVANAGTDPTLWGACENIKILDSQVRGDLTAASESMNRTRRIYELVGPSHYGKLQVFGHEILIALAAGKLGRINRLIDEYQKKVAVADSGIPAMVKIAQAAVRYERRFDETSVNMLKRGLIEHGANESWFDQYAITIQPCITRLNLCDGPEAALQLLFDTRSRAGRAGIETLPRFFDFLEAGIRVRAGQTSIAAGLLSEHGFDNADSDIDAIGSLGFWRERDICAQVLFVLRQAQGKSKQAITIATELLRAGRSGGRSRSEIKGLVLLSLVLEAEGNRSRAVSTLRQAIVLASPEGFVAPFAEEGTVLIPLISELIACGDMNVLALRHLHTVENVITSEISTQDSFVLSEREQEIMQHLADGAANKVIARRLGISDNTVKYHLKKIFLKLDVSTRREAAAKAMMLFKRTVA